MRCLERNKKKFYYCLLKKTEHITVNGFDTGQTKPTYEEPVAMYANVSTSGGQTYNTAAYGQKHVEPFGVDLKYSRTIATTEMDCPIDEYTVLFIDKEPAFDADGNPLYDFFVKRVSKSLNSIQIAIERAEVT